MGGQSYDTIRGALVARRVSISEIARRARCSTTWVRKVLRREVPTDGEAARAVVRAVANVIGRDPTASQEGAA